MTRPIKFFDFDLEATAAARWGPIIDAHLDVLPNVTKQLSKLIDSFGFATSVIKPFYEWCNKDNVYHYDEIQYVAQRLGMEPFHILLMQLVYETSTACTSTILTYGENKKLFFRTMDWPMLFLKDITVGLNVKRGSKHIAKVITWVGYVGFLSVNNIIERYTIAINYRRTHHPTIFSMLYNLNRIRQLIWPIGYLIREIIEQNIKESNVATILQSRQIVSPCYVTIYSSEGTSYVITRDCDQTVDIRSSNLIQTNCDWNKTTPDILHSIKRRDLVQQIQDQIISDEITDESEIVKLLMQEPIINEETIYLVTMHQNDNGDHMNAFVV
jgi:hypothetical protein